MYQPPDQFCAQALLPALADPAGHVRPLPSPRPRQQADRAEAGGEVQGDPAEAARGSLQVISEGKYFVPNLISCPAEQWTG